MTESDWKDRMEKLESRMGEFPLDFPGSILTLLQKIEKRLTFLESQGQAPPDRQASDQNDYAVQLFYLQELDQAYELLLSAHEQAPEVAEIMNNLGVLETVRGNHDQAVEWFQKAISIEPNRVAVLNNRGVLAILQRDRAEAVRMLESAHYRDPQHQTVLYNLGKAFAQKQDFSKAIQMFRLVLSINPEHREAAYQLRQYYQ